MNEILSNKDANTATYKEVQHAQFIKSMRNKLSGALDECEKSLLLRKNDFLEIGRSRGMNNEILDFMSNMIFAHQSDLFRMPLGMAIEHMDRYIEENKL